MTRDITVLARREHFRPKSQNGFQKLWFQSICSEQDKYDTCYHIGRLEKCMSLHTYSVKWTAMLNNSLLAWKTADSLIYAHCITLNSNTYYVSANKDSTHGMLKYWWLRNSMHQFRQRSNIPFVVCVRYNCRIDLGWECSVLWVWHSNGPWNRNLWWAKPSKQLIRVSFFVSFISKMHYWANV